MTMKRFVGAAGLLVSAALVSQCRSKPAQPPQTELLGNVKAVVSVKELMQNMIDPLADNIFDAVGTDVTEKGVVDTKPTTDEDWEKVRIGAVTLAEGMNLLAIPRPFAPPGDENNSGGPNAPELSPEQIKAKVDADKALWIRHTDEIRQVALEVLDIVNKKDADKLFDAGGKLDKACENCHLEYWYPGDKKAVLEDERQHAGYDPKLKGEKSHEQQEQQQPKP